MISVVDAYQKIIPNVPEGKYIANISECENLYLFVMLNKGERLEDQDNNFFTDIAVFKNDGHIEEYNLWSDDRHGKHIGFYDESEIKEMMKRAS